MRPSDAAPRPASATPRRKRVRVVTRAARWRALLVTLLLPTIAAGLLIAAWILWQADETQPPHQRQLHDVEATWRCPAGHEFKAPASIAAHLCPQCGQPAHLIDYYVCPDGREWAMWVQLAEPAPGQPPVADQISLDGRHWVPVDAPPPCPHCGGQLHRVRLRPRTDDGPG